ncbi:clathrin heavy chain, putative [Ixodes scapularis]|uniref:U6 snRNA-associated Sm-like protein LSm1 n=2 Tax=Ixodes TaxID=6944 RepID=B7PKR1_IXOSC|nr:clathrin heavy chain, putative [Ixodes scapularis]|eukprot:XP_002434359.1 clathrin heavy chain, putative [Ixodes scapularis]
MTLFYLPGTASLLEELDKKLLVFLRDGRTLIGYLRSIDQFANLVLHKTIERIHVRKQYGDIPRGIFVVRGDNVVLLGEIDEAKERDVDLEEVSVEQILEVQRLEAEAKQDQERQRAKALKERGLHYHLDLTQLGIPLEHVTWPRVTMTSNQWLCIRHGMACLNGAGATGGADRCSVVTVFNPKLSVPQTYRVEARSAKMNPEKPLLAVTDESSLYLYSTRTKKLLHQCRLMQGLVYWTWVSASTLGLVTRQAVFHWDLSSAPTEPTFMFALSERLRNTELVSYITDAGFKWLAVTGLFQEEKLVSGLVQLHSVSRGLLLLASRDSPRPLGKLHVAELGTPHAGALRGPLQETLEFFDPLDKFDFPVSLQVSSRQGLVFVLTKCGVVHLCDLETATPLCSHVVCPDITFAASLSHECGLLIVSRNGQVLLVEMKKAALLRRVAEVVNRPAISTRLRQTLP